jgi:MFS superfamily sulfate permease-like transporter
MSLIVAAVLCLATILFLTPLFAPLPEVILAALIIFAVTSLMKVRLMLWYYRVEPAEFWMGMTALMGVLIFGVLPGLAAAVLLTLIVGVYRSSRPYGSVLGQIPGEPGAYSDIRRHPENISIPGLTIFRFNSPVYFANASLFHSHIKELIAKSSEPVRAIIIDMVANDRIDITGVQMLEKLTGELKKNNITFMVAQVHEPVRETIRRSGMGPHFAHVSVFPSIAAAVKSYLKN